MTGYSEVTPTIKMPPYRSHVLRALDCSIVKFQFALAKHCIRKLKFSNAQYEPAKTSNLLGFWGCEITGFSNPAVFGGFLNVRS
jgi:hypothetical protein